MKRLDEMTGRELVEEHNRRCAPGDEIGTWKKAKAELVAIVEALGAPEGATPSDDATDEPAVDHGDDYGEFGSISELTRYLLVATRLSHGEIVDVVRNRFPDARTTRRSVASVACDLRRRGEEVALRRHARAIVQ